MLIKLKAFIMPLLKIIAESAANYYVNKELIKKQRKG